MIYLVSTKIPPDYSGAGKCIFDFFKFLKKNNINVKLITSTQERSHKDVLNINQFKVNLKKIGIIVEFLANLIKISHLLKTIKQKNENGVVWLVSTSPLTFAVMIIFKFYGFKIITQNTLVGSDDPQHRYNGDILGIKYQLKKLQYKLSDITTCVSPALYEITKNYHKNCFMIPNPVNSIFKPSSKERAEKHFFSILFIGALTYRKGLDIVFETIDIIHRKNPNIKFNLVGSEIGYSCELKKLYRSRKNIIKENVMFAGMQQDVLPWYQKSDLLFFPSRREGFGLVFIEAMACGLPVIAKKIDGITDYIFSEEYDTILETEDPHKYANEILNLIDDKSKYQKLSKLGINLVKRFDEEKIFNNYLDLINHLQEN